MTKTAQDILRDLNEHEQKEFYNISYRFMKSSIKFLGSEIEEKLAEAISSVLGPEWSGELVMRRLTNNLHVVPKQLTLTLDHRTWEDQNPRPKITVIKLIRNIAGIGLRDAKDLAELVIERGYARSPIDRFMGINPDLLESFKMGEDPVALEHHINSCNRLLYDLKIHGVVGEVI